MYMCSFLNVSAVSTVFPQLGRHGQTKASSIISHQDCGMMWPACLLSHPFRNPSSRSSLTLCSFCHHLAFQITSCDSPDAGRRIGSNCVAPVSHVFLWLFVNIMTNLSQYMMITNYSFISNCQELFSSRGHLEGLSNSVDCDECSLPDRK